MSLQLYSSLFLLSLLLSLLFKHLLLPIISSSKPSKSSLPPSISILPFLSHLITHRGSFHDITSLLRRFHSLYGPIFSIHLLPFSPPSIFISSTSLSHTALFHPSNSFSNRPPPIEPTIFLTARNHDISSSNHGYLWTLLRRNLSSEILHSSRLPHFSPARNFALQLLLSKLHSHTGHHNIIIPKHLLQHTMLSIHALMCFGVKLGESDVDDIEKLQSFLLRIFSSFNVFAFFPSVTKILFSKRWEDIVYARRRQAEIFLPLIKGRKEKKESVVEYCYVDSLLDVRIFVEGEGSRRLNDEEMVNLCHEFLSGSATTATALEWTMAELVKHRVVQEKMVVEMESWREEEVIKEKDLHNMPYLKAVVILYITLTCI